MQSRRKLVATAAALAMVAACGGRHGRGVASAARPLTAEEALLARLPAGAELVVEFDMRRVREHEGLGGLWAQASEVLAPYGSEVGVRFDPIVDADYIVVAAYDLGRPEARTLTLARAATKPPDAVELSVGVYALGEEGLLGQLLTVKPALAPELARLRQQPRPEGAPEGMLRITAMLSEASGEALARALGWEQSPRRFAVWFDAIDDAAVVAAFEIPTERTAAWQRQLTTQLAAWARHPQSKAWRLASSLERARVISGAGFISAVVVVAPKRLAQVLDRLRAAWQEWLKQQGAKS